MTNDARVEVRAATEADAGAWDAFVQDEPSATMFHRFGWSRVIQSSFGHQPRYLLAERSGAIQAVLPLIHKTSRLFGNALISNAFCSYGGIAGKDAEATRALEDRATAMAEELRVDYLEFRNLEAGGEGWLRNDRTYATFRKPIAPDQDAIIKSVPRKGRRHAIRQSLRKGLSFERHDDVASFYEVLAESYRNLGTPIYSRRYFETLLDEFREDMEICVARGPDGPIAASMVFFFKDDAHPYYTGGRAAARQANANDFLFLKIMCRSLERGHGTFDFGRSKAGTGSFSYKTYWGFEPRPLCYEYRLVEATEVPDLTPLNPKYRLMVNAWKRLPLPISKTIGPFIVSQVG